MDSTAVEADRDGLAREFDRHRPRLLAMIRFRMDPRLRGRIDPADVLQEAWLDIDRRFPEYRDDPQMPLYLWLRFLTLQKLMQLYSDHEAVDFGKVEVGSIKLKKSVLGPKGPTYSTVEEVELKG